MYWLDIEPRSIEPTVGRIGPPNTWTIGGCNIRHEQPMIRGMRPLLGPTTSPLRTSAMATARRHGEPAHPEMALGMTYLRTLDAAGAIPVVLPPVGTDHLQPLLDRLDGICLSGGPDLDPAAYGAAERHPELGPTEPSLDAFELS